MALIARLRAQRRLVIPKEVVQHLQVREGDVLLFTLGKNRRAVVCAADVRPRDTE